MINLRCAALYALFLAQGQAGLYQGVLISTQCILIISPFLKFPLCIVSCARASWAAVYHGVLIGTQCISMTKLKKGGSYSSGNGCDMVYMFTCKQQISHSLLKMVLVMLMRMVMPVQYDKDVVLVVYVAFVGNGVKASPSVIRVGYSS